MATSTIQPAVLDKVLGALRHQHTIFGPAHMARGVYLSSTDWDLVAMYYRVQGKQVGEFPSLRIETDYGDVVLTSSQFQAPGKFAVTKGD